MIIRDLLIKLGIQSDTSQLDATSKKLDGMKGEVSALSVAAGNVLANLAQQGLAKGIEVIKDGVDQSVQFGREMANISSVLDGGDERVRELVKEVERLSLTFGKSTSEINDGLYDLIGNIGDSKDAVGQLELAMKLGSAGAGTTAEGLQVLTAVTRAYGDTSLKTMKHVADVIGQTVAKGSAKLPELASSLGLATPFAAQLGVSIEEIGAVSATAQGVVGGASETMTALASAMRAIIDRGPPMEKAFKKAFGGEGIKTAKQAISKYGLVGAMDKLVHTTDGTMERVQELFGRVEGAKLILNLTGKQAEDFAQKTKDMGDAAGVVEKQYKAQTTGMGAAGHAMDVAKAKSDALARAIGEQSVPAFQKLEETGLSIKAAFLDQILPVFTQVDSIFGSTTNKTEGLHAGMKVVQTIVIAVAQAADQLVTTMRSLVALWAAFGAVGVSIAKGDIVGAVEIAKSVPKEISALGGGLLRRTEQRYDVLMEETPGQRATAAAAAQMGLGGVTQNMGGININVTAGAGTEASAVARELDGTVRNWLDVAMQQALVAVNPAAGGR